MPDGALVTGQRTLQRPQRGIGDEAIPPIAVGILRTTGAAKILLEQIHRTPFKRFEYLYEFFHRLITHNNHERRIVGAAGRHREKGAIAHNAMTWPGMSTSNHYRNDLEVLVIVSHRPPE
ncbi:hypothetical protein ACQPZZ_12560 [Microbispora sp. CA-135349]|uniref:hypothetical protein n=1 Tax=Microbispora sp. CA-135349 TaxID=3239953 RepID=UPI003D8D3BF6